MISDLLSKFSAYRRHFQAKDNSGDWENPTKTYRDPNITAEEWNALCHRADANASDINSINTLLYAIIKVLIAFNSIINLIDRSAVGTILHGTGAPTESTEGVLGQLYIDTEGPSVYQCTNIADGVYTWTDITTGGFTEEQALLIKNNAMPFVSTSSPSLSNTYVWLDMNNPNFSLSGGQEVTVVPDFLINNTVSYDDIIFEEEPDHIVFENLALDDIIIPEASDDDQIIV
jgi:hypothetical protein